MISQLTLRNFQAHQRLSLTLDRVTTVVGRSDVGKSAIVRALQWLAFNRPSGTAFMRDGTDQVSIVARVDGQRIGRRRTSDSNLYRIDSQELKAVGTSVPEAVRELLNLGSLNFQSQHDAPFWLSLSPGQVSKELNRIVNLDRLDRALERAVKAQRRAKTRVELTAERRDEAVQSAEAAAWAVEAVSDLERVESLERGKDAVSSDVASLASTLRRVKSHAQERDRLVRAMSVARTAFKRVDQARKAFYVTQKNRERLAGMLDVLRSEEGQRCQAEREHQRLEKEIGRLTRNRCPVCRGPLNPSRSS